MDSGSQQHSSDAHELDLPLASMLGVGDIAEEIDNVPVDDKYGSGDGQGKVTPYKCTKHYTYEKIMQLEGVFQRCAHPGQKQRVELAKKLGMEEMQVKFCFQNRRTQKKMHVERHEGTVLQEENEILLAENKVLKEAMWEKICFACSRPVVPIKEALQLYLFFQNMRLADEFHHATSMLNLVAQDAGAVLPLVFPMSGVLAMLPYGSLTANSQTNMIIDPPMPLQLEIPVHPKSINSTSP